MKKNVKPNYDRWFQRDKSNVGSSRRHLKIFSKIPNRRNITVIGFQSYSNTDLRVFMSQKHIGDLHIGAPDLQGLRTHAINDHRRCERIALNRKDAVIRFYSEPKFV